MADPERTRSRKPSFPPAEKERIKHCMQLYHEQGFDLVQSMFELSRANIANVPENTLRAWNKEWKIPFRARHRQPRFDAAKIRPLFEVLYAQPDVYTLDDIVFIIFHRLGVPATKSSCLKWRDKWNLPERYQRRSRDSQSQPGHDILANSALDPSCYQPDAMLNAVRKSQGSHPSGTVMVSDDMEASDADSEVLSMASTTEQATDEPFQILPLSESASPTDRDWLNVGSADDVLIDANISNDGPGEIFDSSEPWTPSYDSLDDLDLVGGSYNDGIIELATSANYGNNQYTQITTLEYASSQQESRDDTYMNVHTSSSITDAHLFSVMPVTTHEIQMIDCIQQYITWIRQDVLPQRDVVIADSLATESALSLRNPPEWKFYSAGYNAAQDTASQKPLRQQTAQTGWKAAKQSAALAFEHPTERLLPCILLFYTNAFIKGASGLHKKNFQVLYELARQILNPTNPLTHLLNLLASSDMSSVGTEITAMAFLVNLMTQDPSTDFNTIYESYELYISALQSRGHLLDALSRCDDLITFAQHNAPSGDAAPLLRAQRRKGRLFFAQRRFAEAGDIFQLILHSWEWLGKPCTFSKEYMVFEDLAKFREAQGDLAGAEEYYSQAVSFSNIAYKPGSSNSLRIMELNESMKKMSIEQDEGWLS